MGEDAASAPPPVLDCARVLQYLIVDNSIEFSGRTLVYVAGKELGAVPCLAICEEKKTGGVLLFYCTSDWTVSACSAHKSVMEARTRAERIYKGSFTHWVDANVSPKAAEQYLDKIFGDDRCSICGRRPGEADSFIWRDAARICSHCAE